MFCGVNHEQSNRNGACGTKNTNAEGTKQLSPNQCSKLGTF